MDFKEFVRMQEAGEDRTQLKGVKPSDDTGTRTRKERTATPSIFDAKFDTSKNNKLINSLAGKFARFFKDLKSGKSGKTSNVAQNIEALGLDDHRKGGRAMALLYLRLLNDILHSKEGQRYDLGDKSEMGEVKSRLQELSPIYPTVFMMGRDLMKGDTPDVQGTHVLVKAMSDLADRLGVDTALDLYKSKDEIDQNFYKEFRSGIDNKKLQDIFNDYFISASKDDLTDGDIIGLTKDEFVSAYYGDETPDVEDEPEQVDELPAEIDSPRLKALAQSLISTAKDVRGKEGDSGFRTAVPEHDAIAMKFAREFIPEKDPELIDKMFFVLNKYGKGDPSIFNAKDKEGDLMSMVLDTFGEDVVSNLIKKYNIDYNPARLKAMSMKKEPSGNAFENRPKLKDYVDKILQAPTTAEMGKMIQVLAQKGIRFTPADNKYILDVVNKRVQSQEPALKGRGIKGQFNNQSILNQFLTKGIDVLTTECVELGHSDYFKECYFA